MGDVHRPERRMTQLSTDSLNNGFLDDQDPDRVASFSISFDNF